MGFTIRNGIFYGDLPYDPLATDGENRVNRTHEMNDQLRKNFSYLIGDVRAEPFTPMTPEAIEAWKKTPEYDEYLKWRHVRRPRRAPYLDSTGE